MYLIGRLRWVYLLGVGAVFSGVLTTWAMPLQSLEVLPSVANPAITRFNDPNYIVFPEQDASLKDALVLFLPGTGGKPTNLIHILNTIAGEGYRVIGLEYNDSPAVVQVCPQNDAVTCSGNLRQVRVFGGDGPTVSSNSQAESIVDRLAALLTYLDEKDAGRHWASYITHGEPDWSRIIVSGFSQGAGMAAFLAKRKEVARVVLFSSPWDYQGRVPRLAPWLRESAATPMDRWFAEYHRREDTVRLIAQAYQALQIPLSNIFVFNLDLPPLAHNGLMNPYHLSTVKMTAYAPQWRLLFDSSL